MKGHVRIFVQNNLCSSLEFQVIIGCPRLFANEQGHFSNYKKKCRPASSDKLPRKARQMAQICQDIVPDYKWTAIAHLGTVPEQLLVARGKHHMPH